MTAQLACTSLLLKLLAVLPGLMLASAPLAQSALNNGDASPAPLQGLQSSELVALTLDGLVLAPCGAPAEGAVVVSSAGGQAVTDADGKYRLEVQLAPDANSLQVSAAASAGADGCA